MSFGKNTKYLIPESSGLNGLIIESIGNSFLYGLALPEGHPDICDVYEESGVAEETVIPSINEFILYSISQPASTLIVFCCLNIFCKAVLPESIIIPLP